MQEAVVFKAAATEKCMKRVQTLLSLNRFGKGAIHAGCAERRQLHRAGRLQEILIPARETEKYSYIITCNSSKTKLKIEKIEKTCAIQSLRMS